MTVANNEKRDGILPTPSSVGSKFLRIPVWWTLVLDGDLQRFFMRHGPFEIARGTPCVGPARGQEHLAALRAMLGQRTLVDGEGAGGVGRAAVKFPAALASLLSLDEIASAFGAVHADAG